MWRCNRYVCTYCSTYIPIVTYLRTSDLLMFKGFEGMIFNKNKDNNIRNCYKDIYNGVEYANKQASDRKHENIRVKTARDNNFYCLISY